MVDSMVSQTSAPAKFCQLDELDTFWGAHFWRRKSLSTRMAGRTPNHFYTSPRYVSIHPSSQKHLMLYLMYILIKLLLIDSAYLGAEEASHHHQQQLDKVEMWEKSNDFEKETGWSSTYLFHQSTFCRSLEPPPNHTNSFTLIHVANCYRYQSDDEGRVGSTTGPVFLFFFSAQMDRWMGRPNFSPPPKANELCRSLGCCLRREKWFPQIRPQILVGREEIERVFSRLSSGRRFSDSSGLRGLLGGEEDFCSGFFCKPKRKDFNDYALGEKCNKTKTASLGCWKLCK